MLEHLFSITYEVGSHSILSKDGALIDSGLPSCCKKIATWKIFGKKKLVQVLGSNHHRTFSPERREKNGMNTTNALF